MLTKVVRVIVKIDAEDGEHAAKASAAVCAALAQTYPERDGWFRYGDALSDEYISVEGAEVVR